MTGLAKNFAVGQVWCKNGPLMVPKDVCHKKTVVVRVSNAVAFCADNVIFVDLVIACECLILYQDYQLITADTTHDLNRAQ